MTLSRRVWRWLASGAILGPVGLTAAWASLGALRPGFSIVSQPISGLGVGPHAEWMNAAFVLSGALLLLGIAGALHAIGELSRRARWTCIALLGLSPLGGIIDGLFTYEAGFVHYLGFMIAFGTPVLSFVIVGLQLRRTVRWRRFGSLLIVGSPLTLVLTAVFMATFNPVAAGQGLGVAGLTERLALLELHGWFVALGWIAVTQDGRVSSASASPVGLKGMA